MLFCCSFVPKSLSVVVVVVDCPVDFFPADFLCRPPIFSNASKFFSVKRARFEGLLAPVSIEMSAVRFRVWWLWVCYGQGHPSILLARYLSKTITTTNLEAVLLKV